MSSFAKRWDSRNATRRSDTNRFLGSLCYKLGEIALQVVEELDHFDSTDQMVEKRARNDGSPVTVSFPSVGE
ncbi:hypothetical protein LB505_008871 [Fusarium chuoi]|nr:hypothetical protein LB505_008871 [Fusarium chuoi]